MSLRFSAHYADPLFSRISFQPASAEANLQSERALREIDAVLTPPFSANAIRNALEVLRLAQDDGELQHLLVKKVVLGLYAHALDLYFSEASSTQEDAEWWADVERSVWSAASYLLQSMSFHPFLETGLLTELLKQFPIDSSRSFSYSSYVDGGIRRPYTRPWPAFSPRNTHGSPACS